MEDKVLVAGIDVSGDTPSLAYWYAGSGEPQIYEDCGAVPDEDMASFLTRVLSGLGAEKFDSVCIVSEAFEDGKMPMETGFDTVRCKIREVCPDAGIVFISKSESAAHYSLNQKKELRVNDVAFFDLSADGLIYNRLQTINSNGKISARVEKRNFAADIMSISFLDTEGPDALDGRFRDLINELFEKQHISTVYLTGSGFVNEEWAKESLNLLCNKRRVFKGRSLYAIGACYYSARGYYSEVNDECRIACDGRTAYETCLEVVYNDEKKEAVLIPAGKLCHEIGDVIVEGIISGGQDKLVFVRRALFGKEVIREEVGLDGIAGNYKDRLLRLIVKLWITEDYELAVSIEDAGFGEFAAKTDFKAEKILGKA